MEVPPVRVRLFAGLRQVAGHSELELELPGPTSVQGCWERLCQLHPQLSGWHDSVRPALNLAYADWGQGVAPGDELAFLPPVSGGAGEDFVRVGPEPIDIAGLTARAGLGGIGALATFVGLVRDPDQGRPVPELVYEAYPDMAEPVLRTIATEARSSFGAAQVLIQHRTGVVASGVASVVVVVAAPHRDQALRACTYAIDELKSRAPIWKSEA
ncbi:MAG: molybdenum cofactor biosynthesis protein MoaE [Candidatus Dormibacteria bacterium]